MSKLLSVRYVPAGESLDAALGADLCEDREALERFVELWEDEASERLGVPVTIGSRSDLINGSRLTVETDDPRDDDLEHRELAYVLLTAAFEAAAARVAREHAERDAA